LAVGKTVPKAGAGRKKANPTNNAAVSTTPWGSDPNRFPKERIFLSIDVIDSTKLKSSLAEKGRSLGLWAENFAAFYSEVLVNYRKEIIEAVKKHCPDNCPERKLCEKQELSTHPINVWKYIGDEVVLVADLTCEDHHASVHVLALVETIKYLNSFFEKKFKGSPDTMRFKGTAWVAGFPVRNIELLDLLVSGEQKVKEFLGPSMDLGFRLAKFASDERLIISASLAYLIANEPPRKNKPFKLLGQDNLLRLPLCFGGLAEVKGIKNNKHPLIWYSVHEAPESKLSFVENDKLLDYLSNSPFINNTIPPFIPVAGKFSPEYMKKYKKAVEEQEKIPGSPFYQKGKPHTPSAKRGEKTTSVLDDVFKSIFSEF